MQTVLVVFSWLLAGTGAQLPVILVPGYGGSQAFRLQGHLSSLYWLNLIDLYKDRNFAEVFSYVQPTHFPIIMLRHSTGWDPVVNLTKSLPTEDIVFPGWGVTWASDTLGSYYSYFEHITNELLKNPFYRIGSTLRTASFDFRRAPTDSESFVMSMMSLVEETWRLAGGRPVVLLAHSMGGPYAQHFLHLMTKAWKERHVKTLVLLSSPLAGVTKSVHALISGDDLDTGMQFIRLRPALRSFSATYFLLPVPQVFGPDQLIVEVEGVRNYTFSELDTLIRDLNITHGLVKKELFSLGADLRRRPEGVANVFCFYGTGSDTYGTLHYTNETFATDRPRMTPNDGDGTVDLQSLRVCSHWHRTYYREMLGVSHVGMLKNRDFLEFLPVITDEQSNVAMLSGL